MSNLQEESAKLGAASYYDFVKNKSIEECWNFYAEKAEMSPDPEDKRRWPRGNPSKKFVKTFEFWKTIADKSSKAQFVQIMVHPEELHPLKLSDAELEVLRGGFPWAGLASLLAVGEGVSVGTPGTPVGAVLGGIGGGLMCAGALCSATSPDFDDPIAEKFVEGAEDVRYEEVDFDEKDKA